MPGTGGPGSAPDVVPVETAAAGRADPEARTAVPATRQTPVAEQAEPLGGRARETDLTLVADTEHPEASG